MTPGERAAFLAHSYSAGFRRHLEQAEEIILSAPRPAYVACSWGKDSVVMLHLAQSLLGPLPVLHVRDEDADLIANFSEVAAAFLGRWPASEYHQVTVPMLGASVGQASDRWMEGRPEVNRFIGLRFQEQGDRQWSLSRHGPIYQYADGTWRTCPLIWWGWKDVWAYIVANDLPYLSVYDHPAMGDKRESRTSSVYSHRLLGGDHGGINNGRIERLRLTSPDYYNLLISRHPEFSRKG